MKIERVVEIVRDTLELDSKKEAREFLDSIDKVVDAVYSELEEVEGKTGDKAKLGKNVSLEKHFVNAQTRRNPKTGEPIKCEAGYKPVMKVSIK